MSRTTLHVTGAEAHAKATAWADAGGPDGALHAKDRARYIEFWTDEFLAMDREDFEAQ